MPLSFTLLLLLAHLKTDVPDDHTLAAGIKAGDGQALKGFFDRYHVPLYQYLRRRGVPEEVCEDLVQQAFITIWERRDRIDPGQSLRAYLYRMAHNRALNHFRDTAKFAKLDAVPSPADPRQPDEAAALASVESALQRAVDQLPARRRAVFELCFMKELTYREAAHVLGVSIKTVENQMGHALKFIRAALQPFL